MDKSAETGDGQSGAAEPVVLPAECTIRTIGAVRSALLGAGQQAAALHVDCGRVERADLTLLQLLLSAEMMLAGRGRRLVLDAVPECVRGLFERGGAAPSFLMPGR